MNGINASNEAYKLIIALKKEASKTDPETLRQIVTQVSPLILSLSDFLEKSYLNKITPRVVQLNIHLLRQFASLHFKSAETAEIGQKVQHYNYALQMQGITHYLYVLSYERPSSSLWTEMGMVYQAALDLEITNIIADNLPKALQKLNTIEKAVKRNLLFAICNAYYLPQPNIQALFRFCTEQHSYLELNKLGEDSHEGFCWSYTTKLQPYPINSSINGKSGLIFNAEPITKAQRQSLLNWPISNPIPILNALSNYKNLITSTTIGLFNNHVFICEYERVIEFFNTHIRSELVWTVNSPTPEHLNFSSLELFQEERRKTQRVTNEDIWGKPKDEKLKLVFTDFGAIKTVKTDIPGFFVCEAIKAKLRNQDLLALYGKDLKPYLAIVRRLEPTKLTNIQKALIQIIPGTLKTVTIWDGPTPISALLRKYQDITQLFFAQQKLATGSVLQTSVGQITLERLIEVTPYFMRYQIGLANEKPEYRAVKFS